MGRVRTKEKSFTEENPYKRKVFKNTRVFDFTKITEIFPTLKNLNTGFNELRREVGNGEQAAFVVCDNDAASLHLQRLRCSCTLGAGFMSRLGGRGRVDVPSSGIGRAEEPLEGAPATVTLLNIPSDKDNHHRKGQQHSHHRPCHLINPTGCAR